MQCVNCLSKDAHLRGIHGMQWVLSPLVVELHCDRCLSNFYFPTFAWVANRLMELTDEDAAMEESKPRGPRHREISNDVNWNNITPPTVERQAQKAHEKPSGELPS